MGRERFVNIDRETPMLLPPDLRDWVRDDDLANFLLVVIEGLDLSAAQVNRRGTGDAQYPPGMMLAVLIYCYASGIFSSRQVERLTHQHLSVRYLAGNQHPDHDTICKFRRENGPLLKAAFSQVLRLAAQVNLGQVGTICIDGTKIVANAAKRRTLNSQELQAQQARLDLQIGELLAQAEKADAQAEPDGTLLPQELRGRQRLREQIAQARTQLAEQVTEKAQTRQAERAAWRQEPLGDCPRALPAEPQPSDRINLSDPQSVLLAQAGKPCVQGYNAQLAVSAELKSIILGTTVCVQTNDRQQFVAVTQALEPAVLARVKRAVVDTGYDNARQIVAVERLGLEVICAPQTSSAKKPVDDQQEQTSSSPSDQESPEELEATGTAPKNKRQAEYRTASQSVRARMRVQASSVEGRQWLKLRSMSVEPIFGLIKSVLGFRRFSLRGLAKVNLEWNLVAVAFNCRRLCHLYMQTQRAAC